MSTPNDLVIRNVLISAEDTSSIHVIDWHIEDIADKCSNNYFTKTSRISIRYHLRKGDGAPKQKIFFVKEAIEAQFHDGLKTVGVYRNEVAVYTNVLPQMYSLGVEYFTPRLYHFNDRMSLWLEDLSQAGYKCVNRELKFDLEHCIYAIRCLAKFHALSVKLENTVGLPDSVKRASLFSSENGEMTIASGLIGQQIPIFIDHLPQHLADRYPNAITYLSNLTDKTVASSMTSSGKFNVLNHGDFSINNIMFKYDKYESVEKVEVIDFQLTAWGSPACDLIYFAITSMKFKDYLEYFPLLLKVYLNTLNKVFGKLDCPVYDMKSLLNDMDTTCPYALYALGCILPYIICDPDEPVDLADAFKTGQLELSNVITKAYGQSFYRECSTKWFEYFAKNDSLRIPYDGKIIKNADLRESFVFNAELLGYNFVVFYSSAKDVASQKNEILTPALRIILVHFILKNADFYDYT